MKTTISILTLLLFMFAGTQKAKAQDKAETLDWLRNHLKTIIVHNNDSILPYTMTKTYTFYDDAFVVKTVKDFYKDRGLNSAPAFGKIWYKDIIPQKDIAFQDEHLEGTSIFTITADPVYSIIGKEEAPLKYWRHFNEPSGMDLYLPEDQALNTEIVRKVMELQALSKE